MGLFGSKAKLATVYLGLDNREQALTWLESAYEERRGWLAYLNVDPMMDRVRGEPRFRALLKMHLVTEGVRS